MKGNGDFYDTFDAGDEWATPRYIWEPLSDALGGFDLDPASGAETTPIAEHRYTKEDDGLSQDWFGDVWCNHPYSRDENPKWAKKAYAEHKADRVDSITMLVPNGTGASWFQKYYAAAKYITLIDGRVEFIGAGDDSATFDSILATFGNVNDEYLDALDTLGLVLKNTDPDASQTTL